MSSKSVFLSKSLFLKCVKIMIRLRQFIKNKSVTEATKYCLWFFKSLE